LGKTWGFKIHNLDRLEAYPTDFFSILWRVAVKRNPTLPEPASYSIGHPEALAEPLPMRPFSLKARYLFPVASPPIPDGVLTVDGHRIVAVGENTSGRDPVDLGNVALLPGLVNAHTHLEFSDLAGPLGEPGMPFADWIAAVVAHRRDVEEASDDIGQRRSLAIQAGLAESIRCGTTTIGEIATPGWPSDPFRASPVNSTVFLELIGLSEDRIGPLVDLSREHIETGGSEETAWHAGLSPHAPFTVHLDLLRQIAELSATTETPLTMHLAETLDELELLMSGTGPFVPLLERLDAWQPTAIPSGTKPLDYLRRMSRAHRSLVIHGNYLRSEEIEFLAAHRGYMSIVYCPRTHAYFGHTEYPLAEMLSAGVNVALGTDSRASNPDLSILEEMRHIYRHCSGIPPSEILRLGTRSGADALGLGRDIGVLTPGARADLTVVELPDAEARDPYEMLFASNMQVAKTFIRGVCYGEQVNLPGDIRVEDS